LVPVLLALVAGACCLLLLGENPFTFYGNIWQYGSPRARGRQRDARRAAAADRKSG